MTLFVPDVSAAYLRDLIVPVGETIGMAAAGMFVAFALGIPIAVAIGTRAPGFRLLVAALSSLRAIPDLTLAILAVVIVGLGPGAGVVALALFYTAMVGRVYADLFLTAERAPLEALRATGASRVAIAAFGLLPLTMSDLLTFGSYAFECAMRASIIVGAVGGGGLGTELVGSLNALAYHRVLTLILVLVALVAIVDRFGALVRRTPRLGLLLVPVGLISLWLNRPGLFSFAHALGVFGGMLPPALRLPEVAALPALIAQTLGMALGGTLLGAVLAFPTSPAAAQRIAPPALALLLRRIFDVARAIPELVWGLVLVVSIGTGPFAGAIALGLHSAGVLGKLYAESFENAPVAPIAALASTGARTLPIVAFGFVPLALGPLVVHTLFRLEWNVRAAAIVGMIGAGGIGQALYQAQQLFFYREMLAYVLVTWGLVALSDWLGERLRLRLGWRFVASG
ncbi:MAG: ABC transporter permease subunit [Candidatus Eremiobacteraeota bacterium]|nr:ABC transporter permease subunit [Candidatus Eremiobacteraeota bacterium]MBC5802547.1 ABC transporter permease subunit [Candidatus Eremiobacteraeota bacterium]MBC5821908.1 ABC transporter permease subunit [Candidatus Eremiobacteraeota bacterium]